MADEQETIAETGGEAVANLAEANVPAPPGEPIHLPGPSYLPVLVAAGTAIALVGVVLNWAVFGLGVATVIVVVARWIGQARAELDELPFEH